VLVRMDHCGEEVLMIRGLAACSVQVRIDHCGEELLMIRGLPACSVQYMRGIVMKSCW